MGCRLPGSAIRFTVDLALSLEAHLFFMFGPRPILTQSFPTNRSSSEVATPSGVNTSKRTFSGVCAGGGEGERAVERVSVATAQQRCPKAVPKSGPIVCDCMRARVFNPLDPPPKKKIISLICTIVC